MSVSSNDDADESLLVNTSTVEIGNENGITTEIDFCAEIDSRNDHHHQHHHHLPPNASNVIMSIVDTINRNGSSSSGSKNCPPPPPKLPPSILHHTDHLRIMTNSDTTPTNKSLQTLKASNLTNFNNATSHPSPYNNKTLATPTPLVNRKLPGLFILIEQNNWSRVAERAKKYPHECQKWIAMKRKSNHPGTISNNSGTMTPTLASTNTHFNTSQSSFPSSPSSMHSGASSPRNSPRSTASNSPHQQHHNYDTINSTMSSSSSIITIGTYNTTTGTSAAATIGYTHVKCKALHHACLKLRSMHLYIQKLINIEVNEYNSFINMQKLEEERRNELLMGNNNYCTSGSGDDEHDNPHHNEHSSCPSPSSCHLTAASSFDDLVDSSKKIAGRISPKFGQVVDIIKRNISSLPTSSPTNNNEEDHKWDDPWIEACKAILTILEVYPEVAHYRETRHGCLPLHLAAFAMCPTPSVTLPDGYKKFKYHCRSIHSSPSRSSSSPSFFSDAKNKLNIKVQTAQTNNSKTSQQHFDHPLSDDVVTSHKQQIGAASLSSSDDIPQSLLPPRPRANSATSCSSANLSVGGYSTVMMDGEGGGCPSIGASSSFPMDKFTHDLSNSNSIESLEKLRLDHSSSLESDGAGASGATTETEKEQVKLLERSSRPPSMRDIFDRESSTGSTYSNCSNSGVSTCSVVMPSTTSSKSDKPEFYLDKYIANEKRRNEYSLKIINALLKAYRKGAAKDSEGGRLPLHTALAGRATLEVVETITKAYPYAARHRTKDASLPLHIAAFHGVSHDEVAPMLLRHYPFATVGKNRFGRTPLEEALLMGGENGRKHQLKLVEALRRPEFYWTSPEQRNILTSSNSVQEVSTK